MPSPAQPPLGRVLKDAALDGMEGRGWVRRARLAAMQIARDKGTVTIDDVHEACPLPEVMHLNTWGVVLRSPMFRPLGWRESTRPVAHGRYTREWELNE